MTDMARVLRTIAPGCKAGVVDAIAPHIADLFETTVTDILEQAHFLAHSAKESDGFRTLFEYGSKDYFKKYDTAAMRKRLGNRKAGDGYRYRGRGIFQLTGLDNYRKGSKAAGIDLVKDPDRAADGLYAVKLADWYWETRKIGPLARADDIRATTKAINGGYNGLADRKTYLARAKRALGYEAPAGLLDASEADPDGAVLNVTTIKLAQTRLVDLGYYMVGKPDGQVGTATIAAVSAFQHDQGLPINGNIDPGTLSALLDEGTEPRAIDNSRASAVPEDSKILKGAGKLITGAGFTGAAGVAGIANGALEHVKAARGYYDQVADVLSPFGSLKDLIVNNVSVPMVMVAGAAAVGFYAYEIRRQRIEDHQQARIA